MQTNISTRLYFGKMAYAGINRNQAMYVRIAVSPAVYSLADGTEDIREDESYLSISGYIYNASLSDIWCGGQCLDDMKPSRDSDLFNEIKEIWEKYHLKRVKDIPKRVMARVYELINNNQEWYNYGDNKGCLRELQNHETNKKTSKYELR